MNVQENVSLSKEIVSFDLNYFQKIHDLVNQDDYNNIAINNKIKKIAFHQQDPGFNKFVINEINKHGYVIIQDLANKAFEEIIEWKKTILGSIMSYSGKYNSDIAVVEYEPGGKHYIDSCFAQPVHTDGAWLIENPRYVSLFCCNKSHQGGDSILVKLDVLLDFLYLKFKNDVELLFNSDAIKISTFYQTFSTNILFRVGNKIGISYTSALKELRCNNSVAKMYNYITEYIHNPKNQIRFNLDLKEMLILDNISVLHSRTKFPENSKRKLLRIWFKGFD